YEISSMASYIPSGCRSSLMKVLPNISARQSFERWRYKDSQVFQSVVWSLTAIIVGILIGRLVGNEGWMFLAPLLFLPFIAKWPVESALGIFVLAIPFDEIAIFGVGGESGATSLTFLVGGAAAAILFVVILGQGRFRVPRISALWWCFLIVWCGITALWALNPPAVLRRLPTAVSLLLLY